MLLWSSLVSSYFAKRTNIYTTLDILDLVSLIRKDMLLISFCTTKFCSSLLKFWNTQKISAKSTDDIWGEYPNEIKNIDELEFIKFTKIRRGQKNIMNDQEQHWILVLFRLHGSKFCVAIAIFLHQRKGNIYLGMKQTW